MSETRIPSWSTREPRFNEPNIGVTRTLSQHFVPRGYLREFERSERKIRVHELGTGLETIRSSKSVAAANGYYDFDITLPDDIDIPDAVRGILQERKVSIEDWLARNVESQGISVLHKLSRSPQLIESLPADDQFALARFLGAMFFRGPKFRRSAAAQRRDIVERLLKFSELWARKQLPPDAAEKAVTHWRSLSDHEILREGRPHQEAELVASLLAETTGWANLFYVMDWEVQSALSGNVPMLYTSDNPLARRLPAVRGDWQWGALTDWNYWFPISPRVLLRVKAWTASPATRHPGGRRHVLLSPGAVSRANLVQSAEAVDSVYGGGAVFRRDDARRQLRRLDLASESEAMRLGWKPGPHFLPPGIAPSTPAEVMANRLLEEENEKMRARLGLT